MFAVLPCFMPIEEMSTITVPAFPSGKETPLGLKLPAEFLRRL